MMNKEVNHLCQRAVIVDLQWGAIQGTRQAEQEIKNWRSNILVYLHGLGCISHTRPVLALAPLLPAAVTLKKTEAAWRGGEGKQKNEEKEF